MKLEIGKTYVDGLNNPITIVGVATDTLTGETPEFPFVGKSPYSIFHSYYRADGTSILEGSFGEQFKDTSLTAEKEDSLVRS